MIELASQNLTLQLAEDIDTAFVAVKLTDANKIVKAADSLLSANERMAGVLQRPDKAGEQVAVTQLGYSRGLSGGALDPATVRLLTYDGTARFIAWTPGRYLDAIWVVDERTKAITGAGQEMHIFLVGHLPIDFSSPFAFVGTATVTAAGAVAHVDVDVGSAALNGKRVITALKTPGDAEATHVAGYAWQAGATLRVYLNAAPAADVAVEVLVFR